MFVPCPACGNAMHAAHPCPHCGTAPKSTADAPYSRSAPAARRSCARCGTPRPADEPCQRCAAELRPLANQPPAPPAVETCPECGTARPEKDQCPHCGADPRPAATNRFAKGTVRTEASPPTPASTEQLEKLLAKAALAVGILAIIGGGYVFAVHGFKPIPTTLTTTGVVKTTARKNPEGSRSPWWGHYSTNIHYIVNGTAYEIPADKDTKDGTTFTVYYTPDRPDNGRTALPTNDAPRQVGVGFAVAGLTVCALAGLILARRSE